MAEVDFNTKYALQPLVLKEKDVVVESDALHLGVSFLHTQECAFNVSYRYLQDALQQLLAHLAVNQGKHQSLAALARDDEVALEVAEAPAFVDFARSSVDHTLVFDAFFRASASPSLSEHLRPMALNTSAIRALNVAANGGGGDVWKMLLNLFQSVRDSFGRLVVQKVRLDE